MSNSPLVNYTRISPNRNSPRNHSIDRITIHCVVGQCTVEALGNVFAPVSRQASSNYGIGYDGRVGMYCPEGDRSWCSSSPSNDHRAVTIEVASDTYHPYAVTQAAYNRCIDLCVDICRRNGKKKLLWLGSATAALNYNPRADEMVMTAHRWFASTICPGDYLYSRFGDIAAKVTARLGGKPEPTPTPITGHHVQYQTWDDVRKIWLPNVVDTQDYAGIYGHDVDCIYADATDGTNLYYQVHCWGGDATEHHKAQWLPEVKNRSDYAGLYNCPIDAFLIRGDKPVWYRAHLRKTGQWLPWVDGYNRNDPENGFAGIIGQPIDAIQIKFK